MFNRSNFVRILFIKNYIAIDNSNKNNNNINYIIKNIVWVKFKVTYLGKTKTYVGIQN